MPRDRVEAIDILEITTNAHIVSPSRAIDLDPAILEEFDKSIKVRDKQTKGSLYGTFYETLCNTPSVILLATTNDPEVAANITSALQWVIPIYGAFAIGAAIPAYEAKKLRTKKVAYELTGDARIADTAIHHMAAVENHDIISADEEKRRTLNQKIQRLNADNRTPLSQRVTNVGQSLKETSAPKIGRSIVSSLSTGVHSIAGVIKQMAYDVVVAPVKVWDSHHVLRTSIHATSINLRQAIDIPLSLLDTSALEIQKNLKERIQSAWKKWRKTQAEEEKELGTVVGSKDSKTRVNIHTLDRIERNAKYNKTKNIGLSVVTLFGRAAEMVFIKKYALISAGALAAAWGSVNAQLAESEPLLQAFNNSSEALTYAGVSVGTTLLAMAALSHMDHTQIETDKDMRGAISKWTNSIRERRKASKLIGEFETSLTSIEAIADPEKRQQVFLETTKLYGRISPSSLSQTTQAYYDRLRRDNAASDEFGI